MAKKRQKSPNLGKNVKILPYNMTFHADKDLKSKNFAGKKVYKLAMDVNSNINFLIIALKNLGLKRPIFLGHPNSGSCVQNAWTFLQHIHLFTNYHDPEKSASSLCYKLR